MLRKLTAAEIAELQTSFRDVLNYDADDPTAPIDPVTYRSPDGDSCLHIAAQRGDYRSAQLLLDAGLDPNDRGDMGQTPLHHAKRYGHHKVAELLQASGSSATIRDEFGKTADEQGE
jgi:ankyrin repeat protein